MIAKIATEVMFNDESLAQPWLSFGTSEDFVEHLVADDAP